ncbi:MAG: hypothetical protein U9Q71_08260 [Pseudomonadota bacterium]|nr:hypothetical protein [Pseudomonadota bacterium]
MIKSIEECTIEEIEGVKRIYIDGYWVRYYDPPEESLTAKKILIDALTRRTFHHTESGINTPGEKLDKARTAFEAETDPLRKRVNGAMLAGALCNRATDIFTSIVELEEKGVRVTPDNELMQECAAAFSESLEMSRYVRHYSGEEGVDELWGEPVRVFTMTVKGYYRSRYTKIAQAMRDIDRIGNRMISIFGRQDHFHGSTPLIEDMIEVARRESETFRSDPEHFRLWPHFVAAGSRLEKFRAEIPIDASNDLERHIKRGTRLLQEGKNLITWIANIRVPMKKSMDDYLERCDAYEQQCDLYAGLDESD